MEKKDYWCGDTRTNHAVGDVGFLVELSRPLTKYTWHELRGHPARTPVEGLPVLEGVVKDSETIIIRALGVGVVDEVCGNGRALVTRITDPTVVGGALRELGFPELGDA